MYYAVVIDDDLADGDELCAILDSFEEPPCALTSTFAVTPSTTYSVHPY
jgi:hypothetical protein